MRRGAAAVVLCLLLVTVSCGSSRTPTIASPSPSEISPPFNEIVLVAKFVEYKVHFRLTGERAAPSGEESWYFKQGKARFDLRTTVEDRTVTASIFVLPDGTFLCSGAGIQAKCSASDLDSARQQNPVAFYQASLFAQPNAFTGAVVEQRHIAGLHGHCYDVRPRSSSSVLGAGNFCYTLMGVAVHASVAVPSGEWSLEASSVTFAVPDSDFTLPAKPGIAGQP